MKHKILIVLLMAFSFCATVSAQGSMTDEQVIVFVQEELGKGKSQQEILTELLKKGVSTDQLMRIRQKAEKMSKSGSLSKKTVKNLGTNATDMRKEETGAGKTAEENAIDDQDTNIADMNENDQNSVYGHDVFSKQDLTFNPSSNMPTPANYILGAGDQLYINIWGASQQVLDVQIMPDGYVVFDGIGPVRLAGQSVTQAKETLRNKLGQFYGDCSIDLSLGEVRSIQVQVMGEVVKPGTYSLSSLCTAFNALYMAGGINKIGTVRNIKVYRNSREVSTIDVYEYLRNGESKGDIQLRDNDVILVGPYEQLVQVKGSVKRPMWYEMKKGETVNTLVDFTGGFSGNAYTKNIRLFRKDGEGFSIHTIDEFQISSFELKDDDHLEVDSVRPRFQNLVEIKGAVKHPGQFQLGGNIQTVKQLLLAADGLREDAYQEDAIMHREKEDMTKEVISINVRGLLEGSITDIPLKNGDVVFIPNAREMKGNLTLTIGGEVTHPGTFPYETGMSIRDFILQAGGLKLGASLSRIDVLRRIYDPNATEPSKELTDIFTFSLDDKFNIQEDTVFFLQPFDYVFIRKSPTYHAQQTATVNGEVSFTGVYALDNKEYRLSDLIKACGGLTEMGDAASASLTRTMTTEEINQRYRANRRELISLYENALKSAGDISVNMADSLYRLKQQISSKYVVAINLEKALEKPGSEYDIILHAGDELNIPRFSNIVNVSGEVMSEVSILYQKGKSLKYYIQHAGGFAPNAMKKKVYGVGRNGYVSRLSNHSSKDIQPGMKIVVPQKVEVKKKLSSAEIVGITSGLVSMAAIIVAVLRFSK